MSALVRAELRRLRSSRSTWGLFAVAVAVTALLMAFILDGAGTVEGAGTGTQQQRDLLLGAGGPATQLLAAVYGALLVTGELTSRTLTASLLVTPDRRRIVLAKVCAAAAAGAGVAAALLALGLVTVVIVGGLVDVTLRPLLGMVLMGAASGTLGVGIGTCIRNQTAAVAAPLLWFVVVEPLTRSFQLTWLRPWLPGGALAAVSGAAFPGALPLAGAACVALAYATALLLPGTRSLLRRDVL
jgi:ABC-2 type transport system permease protein